MFECDDFDQVLSQFDFPEVEDIKPSKILIPSTDPDSPDFIACTNESKTAAEKINKYSTSIETGLSTRNIDSNPQYLAMKQKENRQTSSEIEKFVSTISNSTKNFTSNEQNILISRKVIEQNENSTHKVDNFVSPKHLKRKIINSHFDQKSKRKFPGPAGLLTGVLEEAKDESIGQMEFLSQDMDFTERNLKRDVFESPIWKRLQSDTKDWKVLDVDCIKAIKQQALAGNLRRRKAQTVTAFIETVDRSVTDPLIILRDETGSIKCTLHRDAWSTFSSYIVSEYCALVLQKPTVLTTGGAFKKHYLNITLSNILAIFSSAVLNEEKTLPNGYRIVYEEDFTVIKSEICSESIETPLDSSNNAEDLFGGLDIFFSDDIF